MADIDNLILDLQSDDLEKRYEACKQLQIESQLPDEAIDALHLASKDPNPLIAVTANRALESQKSVIPENLHADNDRVQEEVIDGSIQTTLTWFELIIKCAWATIVSAITIFVSTLIAALIIDIYEGGEVFQNFIFFTVIQFVIPTIIFTAIVSAIILYGDSPILPLGNSRIGNLLRTTMIGIVCGIVGTSIALIVFFY